MINGLADNEDDGDMKGLSRDNKHSRSNRKLAKM